MEKVDTVAFKSEKFAVRIIRLYKILCERENAYDLFRQMLRSGTSIGANVAEAECGISRKDFLSKNYIALKECNETQYWLRLLYRTKYITEKEYNSMDKDCEELRKMLSSITKTVAASLHTPHSTLLTQ